MTKTQPETPIRKAVKQYLQTKGWFVFTVLQGLGAYPGISDLVAIKNAVTAFIEIKTPTGKQSDRQKLFQEDVESHGGNYVVLRSLEQVIEWEKRWSN
jgi:Holliday junction resolvase